MKELTKSQWPVLRILRFGIIEFNEEDNQALTPRCLAHLEGVQWKLAKLVASLK